MLGRQAYAGRPVRIVIAAAALAACAPNREESAVVARTLARAILAHEGADSAATPDTATTRVARSFQADLRRVGAPRAIGRFTAPLAGAEAQTVRVGGDTARVVVRRWTTGRDAETLLEWESDVEYVLARRAGAWRVVTAEPLRPPTGGFAERPRILRVPPR
jgi:hypothetical protein